MERQYYHDLYRNEVPPRAGHPHLQSSSYIFPSPQSSQMEVVSPCAPKRQESELTIPIKGYTSEPQVDDSNMGPPGISLYEVSMYRDQPIAQQQYPAQSQYQQQYQHTQQYQQQQYKHPQQYQQQYQSTQQQYQSTQQQYQHPQHQQEYQQYQFTQQQEYQQQRHFVPKSTENQDLEQWVTVFGLTSHTKPLVMQYLNDQGDIMKTAITGPPHANWIHVQYRTRQQASHALSHSPVKISEGTIVGITPCIDRTVLQVSTNAESGGGAGLGLGGKTTHNISDWRPGTGIVVQDAPKPVGFWTKVYEYLLGVNR